MSKVCIISMPKSGSTALYKSIKEAMPAETKVIYEPRTVEEIRYLTKDDVSDSLTKIMIHEIDKCEYQENYFDKNIVLIRDPRDVFISYLLYSFDSRTRGLSESELNSIKEVFKQKEKNPRDVSIVDLLSTFKDKQNPTEFKNRFKNVLAKITYFVNSLKQPFTFRFADYVDGNLEELSNYLGYQVEKKDELQGWVSQIKRKGTKGDWRNWFTPVDVDFFQDIFTFFIDQFGFEQEWTLAEKPLIEPAHCSEYIQRLIDYQLVAPVKPKYDPENPDCIKNLQDAIKDGNRVAMFRLGMIYLEGNSKINIDQNEEEGIRLLRLSAELGNPKASNQLGLIAKEKDNIPEAINYFTRASEQNLQVSINQLAEIYLNQAISLYKKGSKLENKQSIRKLAQLQKI